jgi:hypothetical protein
MNNDDTNNNTMITIQVTWLKNKQKYEFQMASNTTIHQLKSHLKELTNVSIGKQKLLGLKAKKGKIEDEVTTLDMCLSKKNVISFQLMGTPDEEIIEKNRHLDLVFVIVDQEVYDIEKHVKQLLTRSDSYDSVLKELNKYDEMLIQKMIQLDTMDNLNENAQKDRKELILRMQTIQSYIDEFKNNKR